MTAFGPDGPVQARPRIAGDDMRVLLTASGSRGDIEPTLGLALLLRESGADVRVCAPPDFRQRVTDLGLSLEPLGPPMTGSPAGRPSQAELSQYVTDWPAIQFDTLATAAEGCDAVVAAGVTQVAARSVAEKLGIHYQYVSYQPTTLPSPNHPPMPLPGDRPAPDGMITSCCGKSTPLVGTHSSATRSTLAAQRSVCHRWQMCATTSSPRAHGWPRTQFSVHGRGRRV
ncbi:glycosyltransferase [Nocardia asiatica]|uniref:glycosyltransferase n=1 Tax=Nocardia asiatica TaxID=209252 RepID=UPI003EE0A103